jgi:hypothetical protein
MVRAPRNAKTDETPDTVSDDTNVTSVDEVPAPATSDYPSEDNPNNDLVPAEEANGPVIPEGASRALTAAIKRLYVRENRLAKLDARAAKAEREYAEVQTLLAEKRPGYAADVAEAQVEVDYHKTKAARVEEARSAALGAARARAAGDHETATRLDEKEADGADPIDSDENPTAHPTNAGHVEFE